MEYLLYMSNLLSYDEKIQSVYGLSPAEFAAHEEDLAEIRAEDRRREREEEQWEMMASRENFV